MNARTTKTLAPAGRRPWTEGPEALRRRVRQLLDEGLVYAAVIHAQGQGFDFPPALLEPELTVHRREEEIRQTSGDVEARYHRGMHVIRWTEEQRALEKSSSAAMRRWAETTSTEADREAEQRRADLAAKERAAYVAARSADIASAQADQAAARNVATAAAEWDRARTGR